MQTIFKDKESVDFNKVAEMIQNKDPELNKKPLHEGPYDYNFDINGWKYHCKSDGTYWNWEYRQVGYNG